MYRRLANHNDDIRRLVEKGYAVAVDSSGYLIVRDIPYLDANKALQFGAFVTKLEYTTPEKVKQQNHQVFFTGSSPHNIDGTPIKLIGDNPASLTLSASSSDIVVTRQFSNKLVVNGQKVDYPDFFAKIENYRTIISGPAMALYPEKAKVFTYRKIETDNDSVFKIADTLTGRAEIMDLSQKFKDEVVVVIGLGGTGAYLLDFLVKTAVKEIRGFDGDYFHIHNQFRSPGRFDGTEGAEFERPKADVYQARYENFRHGLKLTHKYIDSTCAEDLKGATFAFVAVDKGSSRKEIFKLLIALKIPFIDVGMGLDRKQGPLSGQLRATYYSPEDAQARMDQEFAMLVDHPDGEYRLNIQIPELNAMNAVLAINQYKKIKGFYFDSSTDFHFVFRVSDTKIVTRSKDDEAEQD